MITIYFLPDGTRKVVDDGLPEPTAGPTADDLAKAVSTVAQRTGLTKIEADALVKLSLSTKA